MGRSTHANAYFISDQREDISEWWRNAVALTFLIFAFSGFVCLFAMFHSAATWNQYRLNNKGQKNLALNRYHNNQRSVIALGGRVCSYSEWTKHKYQRKTNCKYTLLMIIIMYAMHEQPRSRLREAGNIDFDSRQPFSSQLTLKLILNNIYGKCGSF